MKLIYICKKLEINQALGQRKRRKGLIDGIKNLNVEVHYVELPTHFDLKRYIAVLFMVLRKRSDAKTRFFFEFERNFLLFYCCAGRGNSMLDICDSRILLSKLDSRNTKNLARKQLRLFAKKLFYGIFLALTTHLFDLVSYISESDMTADGKWLRANCQVVVLLNGIDDDLLSVGDLRNSKGSFLAVGDWSYQPNLEMLHCILKASKDSQLLRERRIRIVGPNLPPIVLPDYVDYLPWVEELIEVYRGCSFMLAPMFSGSGVKNKVLESAAVGIPVLGTEKTFIGLPKDILKLCSIVDFADYRSIEKIVDGFEADKHFANFRISNELVSWDQLVKVQLETWLSCE